MEKPERAFWLTQWFDQAECNASCPTLYVATPGLMTSRNVTLLARNTFGIHYSLWKGGWVLSSAWDRESQVDSKF